MTIANIGNHVMTLIAILVVWRNRMSVRKRIDVDPKEYRWIRGYSDGAIVSSDMLAVTALGTIKASA